MYFLCFFLLILSLIFFFNYMTWSLKTIYTLVFDCRWNEYRNVSTIKQILKQYCQSNVFKLQPERLSSFADRTPTWAALYCSAAISHVQTTHHRTALTSVLSLQPFLNSFSVGPLLTSQPTRSPMWGHFCVFRTLGDRCFCCNRY